MQIWDSGERKHNHLENGTNCDVTRFWLRKTRLQFILELVQFCQMLPVVRGLGADKQLVMLDDLLESEELVHVLVSAREQVVNLKTKIPCQDYKST